MRVGIAATFKNEARYLLEWIAFHRVVGIRTFFIADNGGDDRTSELLARLHRVGYIQRFDFIGRPAPQITVYNEMIPKMLAVVELVAVIDGDEFIRPIGERQTDIVLSGLFSDLDVSALAINWACYGSSGRVRSGIGLVTKRFRKRAEQSFVYNRLVKSVVRVDRFLSYVNPHCFRVSRGRYIDTTGKDVKWDPLRGFGFTERCQWSGIRIDHFLVKSSKEFNTIKRPRGRGDLSPENPKFFRDHQFFNEFDRNDVFDPMPSWLVWKTRMEILRMQWRLIHKAPSLPSLGLISS
jgi:Glycosyl transferase family 2